MQLDVVVVGGSYAGMSAALQLARARRGVTVVDAGTRRNRFAAAAHGFIAQDGVPPGEIAAQARRQLLRYPTVRWIEDSVQSIRKHEHGFEVRTASSGELRPARVVLATGVVDHLPEVPGLRERWGRHVFHCPYCHGYELRNGRIGVLATGPASLHQAMLLPEWGAVTLLANQALEPDADQERALAARGVRIERARVVRITRDATVVLADGRSVDFDGLFTASRTEPAGTLAQDLDCEFEHGPLGRFVKTDAMKETTVPGVFACGDVARAAGNVAIAVGDGAMAGAAVHRSLVFGMGPPGR
jgi:thioredoxin reductase